MSGSRGRGGSIHPTACICEEQEGRIEPSYGPEIGTSGAKEQVGLGCRGMLCP